MASLTLCSLLAAGQIKMTEINLENYAYPFEVKYLHLNLQQQACKMAYMDVTPRKPNGKSILLLHGKNFNAAYWKQTADTLLQQGFRVIMPDQVGFGKSDKPRALQYSFQLLANNTKQLLDTLGIQQAYVLGHSMGGMLATRFTLMYPERVTKLVLVNPIGLEDYRQKVPYQTVDELYRKELKQDTTTLKKYQLANYYDNQWKPAYTQWLAPVAGWTLNKRYPIIAWNNALTTDMIMTQPVVYEMPNIKVPVLLIIGQRDRTAPGKELVSETLKATMGNYPELGIVTQKKIPDCKLAKIDGAGHLPHIEVFDKFAAPLLAFLQ
jgi:pimeloyl-ACP methyl ester carboxylesterase